MTNIEKTPSSAQLARQKRKAARRSGLERSRQINREINETNRVAAIARRQRAPEAA